MSGQKSEVINSRFANQRISSRRHVWGGGGGGGGYFNTKHASQHLHEGLLVHYICQDYNHSRDVLNRKNTATPLKILANVVY